MLEVLLLIVLCRRIGARALVKGRRKWPYQFLLVGAWVGGEILGMIIGIVIFEWEGLEPYLLMIGMATAGATLSFVFLGRQPTLADGAVTEVFD